MVILFLRNREVQREENESQEMGRRVFPLPPFVDGLRPADKVKPPAAATTPTWPCGGAMVDKTSGLKGGGAVMIGGRPLLPVLVSAASIGV